MKNPGAHKVTKGNVTSIADSDTRIFFPASGYAGGTGVYDRGSSGYYWSSSLNASSPNYGLNLYFSSGYIYPQSRNNRFYGFCVRAESENKSCATHKRPNQYIHQHPQVVVNY